MATEETTFTMNDVTTVMHESFTLGKQHGVAQALEDAARLIEEVSAHPSKSPSLVQLAKMVRDLNER